MRIVIENRREEYMESYEIDVDCLPHHIRHASLCKLSGAFQDWPQCFKVWSTQEKLQYSSITSMTKKTNRIPYWFDSLVRQTIYAPNLEPSEESVISAMKHMRHLKKG